MELNLSILLWSAVNDSLAATTPLFTVDTIALPYSKELLNISRSLSSLAPPTPNKFCSSQNTAQVSIRPIYRQPNLKFISSLTARSSSSRNPAHPATMYLRNGKVTSEPPTRRQTKLTRRCLLQATRHPTSPTPTQPPNDNTPNNNSTPTSHPTTPSLPTPSPPNSPPHSPPTSSPTSSPPSSPTSSPPSSPPSPPYFLPSPSPPSSPSTPPLPPLTKWRCNTCLTTYPITATRRCLSSGCNTYVRASMLVTRRQGLDHASPKKPRKRLEWPIRPELPLRRGRKRAMQRRDCEIEFGFEAWEARNEWRRRRREEAEAEAAEVEGDAEGGGEAAEADAAASATAKACQAKAEQGQHR